MSVEQAKDFINGLITASGERDGSKIVVKLNRTDVSELVRDLIKQMKIKHTTSNENHNWVIFDFVETNVGKLPASFFAGAFVGGGSISDSTSTSYHLEMQFNSNKNATKVLKFLEKYENHFKFSLISRRTDWVLYLKKSEEISNFLRAVEANNSVMEFEEERINRDFQNQLNRYSNLDMYNQSKLAKTSAKFQEQYKFIKDNKLQGKFRDKELEFFELKNKNPYDSLETLVGLYYQRTGIEKTRAGLSHYLMKLRRVIDEHKN